MCQGENSTQISRDGVTDASGRSGSSPVHSTAQSIPNKKKKAIAFPTRKMSSSTGSQMSEIVQKLQELEQVTRSRPAIIHQLKYIKNAL